MVVTIDRFEEYFAVCECEDKTMINIEIYKLPDDAKEGDVLIIEGDNIRIDHEKTKAAEDEIMELLKNMWLE